MLRYLAPLSGQSQGAPLRCRGPPKFVGPPDFVEAPSLPRSSGPKSSNAHTLPFFSSSFSRASHALILDNGIITEHPSPLTTVLCAGGQSKMSVLYTAGSYTSWCSLAQDSLHSCRSLQTSHGAQIQVSGLQLHSDRPNRHECTG